MKFVADKIQVGSLD